MSKNGNKFSTSQLLESGFRQDAQGRWSKDHLENRDTRPSFAVSKSDSRRKVPRSSQAEEVGKEVDESCYRYRLVIHSYRTRLLDFSNMHSKAIEDTLVKAGIIPDDSPKYCDQPLVLETKVKPGEEKTIIEVLKYRV